jgi:hypothetical protein
MEENPMTLLFLIAAALLSSFSAPVSDPCSCLPSGIKATDVVSSAPAKLGANRSEVTTITVAQTLKAMKARCHKGKLVDTKGEEIRFYRLVGCWGNPPQDYEEILARQAKELESLRKRYHVIEMTCNPEGIPIAQSHRSDKQAL